MADQKIIDLAAATAPATTQLTYTGDPATGLLKKTTGAELANAWVFNGALSADGVINQATHNLSFTNTGNFWIYTSTTDILLQIAPATCAIGDYDGLDTGTVIEIGITGGTIQMFAPLNAVDYSTIFKYDSGTSIWKIGDIDSAGNDTLITITDTAAKTISLACHASTGLVMNGSTGYTGTVAGAAALNVVNGVIVV